MASSGRFTGAVVDELRDARFVRVRAGTGAHRFTAIWVVVVEGRVFVRSWGLEPGGWYRTFLEEPRGAILVGGRELPVRAVRTRSDRLAAAVDRAYVEKYTTRASAPYAHGLGEGARRTTTTELVPDSRARDGGTGTRSAADG
jgi:hypothetical protein